MTYTVKEDKNGNIKQEDVGKYDRVYLSKDSDGNIVRDNSMKSIFSRR